MSVVINGRPHDLERSMSLEDLFQRLGLRQKGMAVELNEQIIPRARHAEVLLSDGDRLEIVSLVGGG